MLTFEKFSGINNVLLSHRLGEDALTVATNVDIGLTGDLSRRAGYAETLGTCHKNLHQAAGFLLSTVDGGDLIAMDAAGGNRVMLSPSLGPSRVWYCNMPDGRTTFSNGLIHGITDGMTATGWGVPVPDELGSAMDVAGALFPGEYHYHLTHVRLSDGQEGGAAFGGVVQIQDGGLLLTGLSAPDGHMTNVYLSSHNSGGAFLAGSTLTGAFSYLGKNDALTLPLRTENLVQAPVGTLAAFWRGRMLVAVGNVLHASLPHQWEIFDPLRDFKQFAAPITLVQPVENGIYVGTEQDLAFLGGTSFDQLTFAQKKLGPVVLGSGVTVPGDKIKMGDGRGSSGDAMLCIAGGAIVAGFDGGQAYAITAGRYETTATEVAATFREVDGIPQYIAVPQ